MIGLFKQHHGAKFGSTKLMMPVTQALAAAVLRFSKREGIELVHLRLTSAWMTGRSIDVIAPLAHK